MAAALSIEWIMVLLVFFSALSLMLIVGGPMISWLRAKRWRKGTTIDETWTVREDTPDTHQVKQGTPSMGGIGIISVGIATFVAFAILDGWVVRAANIGLGSFNPIGILVLCTLLLTVGLFAGLGFTDDWSKATGRGGLRGRAKSAVPVAPSTSCTRRA